MCVCVKKSNLTAKQINKLSSSNEIYLTIVSSVDIIGDHRLAEVESSSTSRRSNVRDELTATTTKTTKSISLQEVDTTRMGRLSTFAKNRILNLRFQKSFRIKQIAQTLLSEDNIKVSGDFFFSLSLFIFLTFNYFTLLFRS